MDKCLNHQWCGTRGVVLNGECTWCSWPGPVVGGWLWQALLSTDQLILEASGPNPRG